MRIYFPASFNIIVKGHVRALEKLSKQGEVVVGLLHSRALKGYKKERVPFAERKYITEALARGLKKVRVVPQYTLDPSKNVVKYKCNAIASGDGWEASELAAIKKLGIKRIDVRSGCTRHSSDITK